MDVKYDRQSLQEAKIGRLVYTLCLIPLHGVCKSISQKEDDAEELGLISYDNNSEL